MRKLIFALIGVLMSASFAWAQDVYVRGYFRSDGTYVQPHYRSAPNNTVLDNWSTRGNVNPYTGQRGTKNPYAIQNNRVYQPNIYTSPTYKSPLYTSPTYQGNTGYQ